MSSLSHDRFLALRDAVHEASFSPGSGDSRGIGVEVELLAHDIDTSLPIPLGIDGPHHIVSSRATEIGPRALVPMIARIADQLQWRRFHAYDGTARFDVPGRATISFEPGGQIEISSVAGRSVTEIYEATRLVIDAIRGPLEAEGVMLRAVGIDPFNDASAVPLQLAVPRYERMTRYFETLGPFGIRMMRQTAAVQVSVDRGADPAARWRLLNDLAPYLVAVFASSPIYRGEDTGHQSYRAHCWRQLDATRTGIAEESDAPADAYTRFALAANDMARLDDAGAYRSFADWLASDAIAGGAGDHRAADSEAFAAHLTTLFPEVRPRGHYEVRSCDAVAPEWLSVPLTVVAALTYDEQAGSEAALLAAESRALLRAAGERGLRDEAIARTARDLFQLALDGARRLGPRFVASELVERAVAYYETYTSRDRAPADDARARMASRAAPGAAIRSPI